MCDDVRTVPIVTEILPQYYENTLFYFVCYGSFSTIPVRELSRPCVLNRQSHQIRAT